MKDESIVVELTYNAAVERVWNALTNVAEMKTWYFDIKGFKPEAGSEFYFDGDDGKKTYRHHCKITEVVKNRKLSHTWAYEGYSGSSTVTWELFQEGSKTRVRLTHAGLETFQAEKYPELARKNFETGWNEIVGKSLKEFVEKS